MSPTNPGAPNGILNGQALLDLSAPPSETLRGGINTGFDGSEGTAPPDPTESDAQPLAPPPKDFTGLGSWLESDDGTVFRTANNLVLRQELVAINHWEIDTHYTRLKLGAPFSILERDPKRDTYRCTLPTGTKALTVQAVPNQAWDLVNKATEAVLVDPPEYDPQPLDDSEHAHAAAEMAKRVLTEDAGENGTNDIKVFYEALDGALVTATKYIELYTNPVGGGYVPLQILAHPLATDPSNPMVGPDGGSTVDPILRYLTAPQGGQFTDQPAQAAPAWQAKIRATVWGREHWRCFPESATVETAEKMIGLLYCTIAEAKQRFSECADYTADDWNDLLSWTPPRFLNLLPPFQRARWKISNGSDKEKSGSSDERILFFYKVLQKAVPAHPHGAEVYVSGANTGTILHKDVLAATVTVPTKNGGESSEVRCMDLPLVQLTPRADPDERDPTGLCYMALFCGAVEFNATLATGFLQALNNWLNPDSYIVSTSSVQGHQVEESRASGDAIPVLRVEDKPTYGNMPPIPPNFFEAWDRNDEAIRSISSLNKPVTGQDSNEVSGKARQIAVSQGMVGLSRMQHPTNSAFERFGRVKLQLMMRDYSTPQQLRYVGEDGSWQQEQFSGTDFALVGGVQVLAGTGTMMPPDQKVNYLASLKSQGLLSDDEAKEAARQNYADKLGLSDDAHQQYIERCVAAWLKGPPTKEWPQQWQQYTQQKQAYDQQQQQYAQQMQAYQTAVHNTAIAAGGPPPALLGPESQNAQAMQAYQNAVLALQQAPLGPMPQKPQGPAPTSPWHPFQPRPNDGEPPIAMQWLYRLSKVISTVKFDAFGPEWAVPLTQRYQAAVTVQQNVQKAQLQQEEILHPQSRATTQAIQGAASSASSLPSTA